MKARSPIPAATKDLQIQAASVTYLKSLDLLVFEQRVEGRAGGTVPEARGNLDGAPVLGYVFPTTLDSTDVGFREAEGIVALAVTSHPDFDDTPLWDENGDRNFANDGVVFHTHWVLLQPEKRVPGGLAVGQIDPGEISSSLPPTNPGMPMFMDSPGFAVLTQDGTLKVLVPAQRMSHRTDFRFDAVTAYMEVNTSPEAPMLGVYKVYNVLSEDLSLPFEVKTKP
ncbi:MAG: hypothetical protein K0U98_14070 [Deltaproteobacteria bacterium]|nr:hypothetical protein [Deltaproteobacteria bacterium]